MEQHQRHHPSLTQTGVILRITNAERRRRCLDDIRRRRGLLRRKPGNAIVTPSVFTPPPPSDSILCRPSSYSSHAAGTPKKEKEKVGEKEKQKEKEKEKEKVKEKEMTIRGHPHLRSFLVENFLPDCHGIAFDSRRRHHGSRSNYRHQKGIGGRDNDHDERQRDNRDSSNARAKYRILRHAINSVSPLIRNGMDRPGGIQLSVDNPWKSRHFVVNVERPAVLRQYFGRTVERKRKREVEGRARRMRGLGGKGDGNDRGNGSDGEFVKRYCYGSGTGVSSVGINPK
mmetsp:Transcript_16159/g.33727  ORF Transcript_16159/g.33727 Transcript_16159/m.33727 type:complete len:285 (+) Transcript_16159:32-886(+)